MRAEPFVTRRSVLRTGTAATGAACALALAGCAPATDTMDGDSGGTAGPIPTTGTPVRVGKVAELAVGATSKGKANEVNVVLFRPTEDTILAYSDVCTHAGCQIAPKGAEFRCPCHGSVFAGADGSVVTGPAKVALPRYAAAIDGEWITVSV